MDYKELVDLIEQNKRILAEKAVTKGIEYKVIDNTQLEVDRQGFEASFLQIAAYVRSNDTEAWRTFVELITQGQIERGVPDKGAIDIADYMMETIFELIETTWTGPQYKELREKSLQRLKNLHSLGRVTILVTQIKAHGGKLKGNLQAKNL